MLNAYQPVGNLVPAVTWLQRQLEELLDPMSTSGIRAQARGAFPALNVGATTDAIEVIAFVPGVGSKDIELTVERGLLTIAGERSVDAAKRAASTGTYAKERFAGRFRRVIALPEDADPSKVDAKLRDGILHVSVARRESSKPRQIDVRS